MRAASALLVAGLLAGCSLFKPAPNVAFTVEPGTEAEDPKELATVLRARLEGMGAPAAEVAVKGRTVEVRTHFEEPQAAVTRLLRPFHVEFALADDRRLFTLSDELLRAHPALVPTKLYGEPEGQTVCSKDRAVLKKALAAPPVPDRVWAVETRHAYDAGPAVKPDLCAVLLEPTVLDNRNIVGATAFQNEFGAGMAVRVEFSEPAGQQFASMTGSAVKRRLAIVLDGEIVSLPVIQEKIAGGRAHITMGHGPDSDKEAMALAAALAAQPLSSAPKLLTIKVIGAK